jgi:hypothetical protein
VNIVSVVTQGRASVLNPAYAASKALQEDASQVNQCKKEIVKPGQFL